MTFFRVGVAVPTATGNGPAGGSPVTGSGRPHSSGSSARTASLSRSRKAGPGSAAFGAAPGSGVPHGVTEGSWGRESFAAKPPPGGGSSSSSSRSDASVHATGADGGFIADGLIADGSAGADAHEAERLAASLRSQVEATRRLAEERAAAHARDRADAREASERKAAADAVIMTQLQKQLEVTQEKLTALTRGE